MRPTTLTIQPIIDYNSSGDYYDHDGTGLKGASAYASLGSDAEVEIYDINNTQSWKKLLAELNQSGSVTKLSYNEDNNTTTTEVYDPESGHLRARFAEGTNGEVVGSNDNTEALPYVHAA